MVDSQDFSAQLMAAVEAKTQWYNTVKLPELLENYRIMHSCVKNLYDLLVKKSRITKDPYKLEKKISDVRAPENTPFPENEVSVVLGTRFSDYESMLDFISIYFSFSISNMTLERIKNLAALNNSFLWDSLSTNSSNVNTRCLAKLIAELRVGTDPMTASALNNELSKNAKLIVSINSDIKELSEFQKEVYKVSVRKKVIGHKDFDRSAAFSSPQAEMQQIKKIFPSAMDKTPFYTALIEEIIEEDQGPGKEERRKFLFAKLQIQQDSVNRNTEKVDPRHLLLDAIHGLAAVGPQINLMADKLRENHNVLVDQNNSRWQKFLRLLRKAFNISEPEVEYQVYITDPVTKTERKEYIKYAVFMKNLTQISQQYMLLSAKTNPIYKRIQSEASPVIVDFLNKNFSQCQRLLLELTALDDFFKSAASQSSLPKIKGMRMELTTFKNILVKANQRRVEYLSSVEEDQQFRKLGILNDE
ncbi:hypothetical protein [Treponema parvum]|uniref:hypothetical protein n=1 Tax=Treponema parvum TaxID=138851 RepID=UPI001AEBEE48|nr:hypothetical protein [Treponema parvum]QTQ16983.1 hypothetical protein HXT04_09910 [Treponema parvum]